MATTTHYAEGYYCEECGKQARWDDPTNPESFMYCPDHPQAVIVGPGPADE